VLNKYEGAYFSQEFYRKAEMLFLNTVEWNLETVRFYDILQLITAQGIMFSNEKQAHSPGGTFVNPQKIVLLDKYIELLALLCLQDSRFINDNPYILACSIVAAARTLCGFKQGWREELDQLTGLKLCHVSGLKQKIEEVFQETFLDSPTKQPGPGKLVEAESPTFKPPHARKRTELIE